MRERSVHCGCSRRPRRIGHEALYPRVSRRSSLDEIADLIDRSLIEAQLSVVYAPPRGQASWPPLASFPGRVAGGLARPYPMSVCRGAGGPGIVPPVRRVCAHRGDAGADGLRAVSAGAAAARSDPASQREAERGLSERNRAIPRTRARVENILGTWKRSCGFRRMRWRGPANARLQARLAATAYDLTRTAVLLAAGQAFRRVGVGSPRPSDVPCGTARYRKPS